VTRAFAAAEGNGQKDDDEATRCIGIHIMDCSITVTLPDNVREALDDIARRDGVPTSEIVGQAVKEHLFLRQFRLLRERMSAKGQATLTDQDVFDRVS